MSRGILQPGRSKSHHPDPPQLKLALAAEVRPREQANDPASLPLIARQLLTFVRTSSQCPGVPEAEARCTYEEAPDDALWGVQRQWTTSGVQREISSLRGRLTVEEAAETVCRHVLLLMSARQTPTAMRPVGKALAPIEDRQVNSVRAQYARSQPQEKHHHRQIE